MVKKNQNEKTNVLSDVQDSKRKLNIFGIWQLTTITELQAIELGYVNTELDED